MARGPNCANLPRCRYRIERRTGPLVSPTFLLIRAVRQNKVPVQIAEGKPANSTLSRENKPPDFLRRLCPKSLYTISSPICAYRNILGRIFAEITIVSNENIEPAHVTADQAIYQKLTSIFRAIFADNRIVLEAKTSESD